VNGYSRQGKKDAATSVLSTDVGESLKRRARKVLKFQPAAVADAVAGGTVSPLALLLVSSRALRITTATTLTVMRSASISSAGI
jgi:hypothetical protein